MARVALGRDKGASLDSFFHRLFCATSLRGLYKKLPRGDWIRILVLEPGKGQDPIVCDLQVCNVQQGYPPYEAISYVWGSSKETLQIICNQRPIQVTLNLGKALERLRRKVHPRLIWADAICINQENDEERSHQVRLMNLVYRNASKVLIWAGLDESHQAAAAFSLIRKIVNTRKLDSTTANLGGCSSDFPQNQDDGIPSIGFSGWSSLRNFYRNTWFRRLWVLQEVVLSSSAVLIWGEEEIPWELIGSASEYIQDDHQLWNAVDERAGIGNAYLMHSLRKNNHALYSFRVLLQRSRRFKTKDPRDRIFAVLGLPTTDTAPELGDLFLEPDYKISRDQLYLKVARKLIEKEQNLGLLSAVQHSAAIREGTSSWVPQWDSLSINILAGVDGRSQTTPAGLPKFVVEYAPTKPSSLMTKGLELDRVTQVSDTIFEGDFQTSALTSDVWPRRIEQIVGRPIQMYLEALSWTMTAGKDWADEPIQNPDSHWADFAAWWVQICGQNLDRSIIDAAQDGTAARFAVAASDCWNRRLYVTSNGHLGLGPEALHQGDHLCILMGGPVPYVLRKIDQYYLFVGESYVYGTVQNEAIQKWREGKLALDTFELR